MPPAGIKPIIPGSERPQTHALDRAATGTGNVSGTSKHKHSSRGSGGCSGSSSSSSSSSRNSKVPAAL